MKKKKTIALVAHDNRKQDLVEWVEWNYETLADFIIFSPLLNMLKDYRSYITREVKI